MTFFDELQQNAKNLSIRLFKKYQKEQIGCFTFFPACLIEHDSALDDAATIVLLAASLDQQYDEHLANYFKDSISELQKFKTQILIGIYLLKWIPYNSVISNYRYSALLHLFREDLHLSGLENLEPDSYKSCLESLSWYCSYVHHNERIGLNCKLNKVLGTKIQLEIHEACTLSFSNTSSSYERLYQGILDSLGF